jgi:hypothetical protein
MNSTPRPASASAASSAVSSSPCTAPLSQAGAETGRRVRLYRLYKLFRATWDLSAAVAFRDARDGVARADAAAPEMPPPMRVWFEAGPVDGCSSLVLWTVQS